MISFYTDYEFIIAKSGVDITNEAGKFKSRKPTYYGSVITG